MTCSEVKFPNSRKWKTLVLCFDILLFRPTSMLKDATFVLEVLAWLRGVRAPSVQGVRMRDETAELQYEGIIVGYPETEQVSVTPEITMVSPTGVTKIFRNGRLTATQGDAEKYKRANGVLIATAVARFPDPAGPPASMTQLQRHVLANKCNDLVAFTDRSMRILFYTTRQSVDRNLARSPPTAVFKAVWSDTTKPSSKSGRTFRLIDSQISNYPISSELDDYIKSCVSMPANLRASRAYNAGDRFSKMLSELFGTLNEGLVRGPMPRRRIVSRVMTYRETLFPGFYAVLVDWDFKL